MICVYGFCDSILKVVIKRLNSDPVNIFLTHSTLTNNLNRSCAVNVCCTEDASAICYATASISNDRNVAIDRIILIVN